MVQLSWFNPDEVKDVVTGVVPEGTYTVCITDVDMVKTKNGDGHFLAITFQIVDGDEQGAQVIARLNVDNPSKVAQEIGLMQFKRLCNAVGIPRPNDSSELLNIPLQIHVKVRKSQYQGKEYLNNDVDGYQSVNGAAPKQEKAPWE